MTPAEELTAAADKLDALVADATDGPWRELLMGSEGSKVVAGGNTVSTARHIALARGSADATYIAAMNPLVGKTLLEMLREEAAEAALYRGPHAAHFFRHGLRFARLINGGEA